MARSLALDVADGGLIGIGDDGSRFGPSPGVALVGSEQTVFGAQALRAGRLEPRRLASDFWARLDEEPLGSPFPPGLRAVDLVHGHLDSLWREARTGTRDVLLAVPGAYDERQIGRLVGIAQALGMSVAGAVDAGVAAATGGFGGERLLHVDLGQSRALVTQIRQGSRLVRERVATIERWGADAVRDAQMRGAAEAFVKQARFDPLHDAASEQALFDRLPGWLATLEHADGLTATLPAAEGREVETVLTRAQAEAWTARHADELQQQVSVLKHTGEPTGVLLTAHAARLPGLAERLGSVRGVELAVLPVQAAALGALRAQGELRSPPEALRFVTRLSRPEAPEGSSVGGAMLISRPPRPASVGGGRRPTHVLLDSAAHAIGAEPLVVGTAPPAAARGLRLTGQTAGVSRAHCRFYESAGESVVEDLSTWGTYLNGERVAGRAVLAAGDRVRVGSPGIELVMIAAGEG
jgi:hypothetical protein